MHIVLLIKKKKKKKKTVHNNILFVLQTIKCHAVFQNCIRMNLFFILTFKAP